MHRTPARLGRWFALTLALPAAFAILWAWLVPGGVVSRARDDERLVAGRALADAVQEFEAALRSAASEVEFVLRLDSDRRVVAPFAARTKAAFDVRDPGVAEQAAMARLRDGQNADALEFFGHGADRNQLTPEGWLAYASLRAKTDPVAAAGLLADARKVCAGSMVGPLPFEIMALLVEVRRPADRADLDAMRDRFCRLVERVPVALVETVLADIQESPALLGERRAAELLAAARFADRFALLAAPAAPIALTGGDVCMPRESADCVVLPVELVARMQERAFAQAGQHESGVVISRVAEDAVTERVVATTAETWFATTAPNVTPSSVVLQRAANGCLALALITLVLGNLLLLRLTRRESQLVRLRADFVDVVSHELRTPLTALSLKSEMLASGDVPERRRDHYLHGLHQDVLRLNDQVERILDFGHLQKGAPLRQDRVPGRSLLAHGLRSGRPALRLVAQHVDVDAPRQLPTIVGDVEVLGRALRNLLENAAKYAPAGSRVGVRAFASGGELCVEIADQGPGIAAEERESIFQPFVRGEHATSGTPGSGLGLALVAAAAVGHGGRVTVGERSGGGAVFTLHLPVAREGDIA